MPNELISFRPPPDLLARLDAYAEQLDAERPGTRHGRAGALKVLMAIHLPKLADSATSGSVTPSTPASIPVRPAKSTKPTKSAKPAKRARATPPTKRRP